jgi:hypothetical protein
MALSDDQRALLRLLAQREQGYEDIAALKGMSVDEVRAEVRGALAALDAPPPEPPPPPPPAPAPEPEPAPPVPAPEPKPPASPAKPKRTAGASSPQRPVPTQRRRLVLIAAGCLAALAAVLGAIAIFSGGSDSGSSSASTGESATEIAAGGEGSVTQAVLESADGSDAAGRAIFGRVGKKEVVLQVTAENLEPTEEGQSYTVWLYRTPKLSLRVGSVPVGETGKLGARFSIPAELLAYVASGAFDQVYVSRTSNAAYQQEVAKARKEKSLPRYTGETVLSGEITGPIAKATNEGG